MYSRNVYRNCQTASGRHCVCCGSPADRGNPVRRLLSPALTAATRSVRNGLVVLKRSDTPVKEASPAA